MDFGEGQGETSEVGVEYLVWGFYESSVLYGVVDCAAHGVFDDEEHYCWLLEIYWGENTVGLTQIYLLPFFILSYNDKYLLV